MKDFSDKILLDYFKTFLLLLSDKVRETYLYSFTGDDLMDDTDKKKHFLWCYEIVYNHYQNNNFSKIKKESFLPKISDYFNKNFYYSDKNITNLQKKIKSYHLSSKGDDLYLLYNTFSESLY